MTLNEFFKRVVENVMTRSEAEKILGLSGNYSETDVKTAYRSMASKSHPDKGGSDADMQRINNAKATLDKLPARSGSAASAMKDVQTEWDKAKAFVIDDLMSRVKPAAFAKHLESIFGEPFTAKLKEFNSSYSYSITVELKNATNDKMFQMSVHPDVSDMRKSTPSFGSSTSDIPYRVFISGFNFSNNRKQKLSDFAWTNNSNKFADPETVFPKAKLSKKVTRKFSKRDMLTALDALGVTWASDRNGAWLPLADDNFLHIVRMSMMGTATWTVYGTCARKGKYSFSDLETMVKTFEENENILAAFRRFTKMNANQVIAAVKKMSHDGTP